MKQQPFQAGTRFGRLITTGKNSGYGGSGTKRFECVCDCGTITWPSRGGLATGQSTSCGCLRLEKTNKRKLLSPGTRFGRLTVTGNTRQDNTKTNKLYECRCDCGNTSWSQRGNLVNGTTKSCGCLRSEVQSRSKRRHLSHPAINLVIHHYRYAAKKRKLEWKLTFEEAEKLLQSPCEYCGLQPSKKTVSALGETRWVGGIDRVDNRTGYLVTNCVACCQQCNQQKMDSSPQDWREWVDRFVRFQSQRGIQSSHDVRNNAS